MDDRSDPSRADATPQVSPPRTGRRVPAGIAAVAACLTAVDLGTTAVASGPQAFLLPEVIVGHLLTLALTGSLAAGALLLDRSDVAPARYRRVGTWFLGGLLAVLAINLALIGLYGLPGIAPNVQWANFAAALGGLGGFVVGAVEARAIDRAVASEREAVRAAAIEAHRDWLDYLNSLLRHEVLNNANVIEGYAQLIAEESDDPAVTDHAERIRRQGRNMTGVIQDVRILLDATRGEPTVREIELEDILRQELAELRDAFGHAETELTVAESATVAGDEILARVFANLFQNAVEHNDAETPRITVELGVEGDTAVVTVADNGPGITERTREGLFERGEGDHGLGLYLVDVLVRRYGGDVELTETGPEGSVFTVELPLADATEGSVAPASRPDFPLEAAASSAPPASAPEESD